VKGSVAGTTQKKCGHKEKVAGASLHNAQTRSKKKKKNGAGKNK